MEKVQISKSGLTKDVEAGMKREEIIEKYSTPENKLSNADVTKMLKACNLKIRKFSKPKFVIIDDQLIVLGAEDAKETKEIAEAGNVSMPSRLVNLSEEPVSEMAQGEGNVDDNN